MIGDHAVVVVKKGVVVVDSHLIAAVLHVGGIVDLTEGDVEVLGVADHRDGGVGGLVLLHGDILILQGIDSIGARCAVHVGHGFGSGGLV